MAYVSRGEQALVSTRLYLPKEWTKDKARRKEAGVPKQVKLRTRRQLALEMLDESAAAPPHSWVAGDDEVGRPSGFRGKLRGRGERYLLGAPSNTLVRDLDVPPPEYSGRGRRPKSPFLRLDLDQGAGRREGSAGRGGRQASGASEDRDRRRGPGGVAPGGAREAIGRDVQARLLSVEHGSRGTVGANWRE